MVNKNFFTNFYSNDINYNFGNYVTPKYSYNNAFQTYSLPLFQFQPISFPAQYTQFNFNYNSQSFPKFSFASNAGIFDFSKNFFNMSCNFSGNVIGNNLSFSNINNGFSSSGDTFVRSSNDIYSYNNSDDIFAKSNETYLRGLTPEMRTKTEQLIAFANKNGYDLKITSGRRSESQQAALRERYKNEPGRAAKNSPHCKGKAIDVEIFKDGKKLDSGYTLVGNYATNTLGMRWGGNFKTYRERWHFDYNWA